MSLMPHLNHAARNLAAWLVALLVVLVGCSSEAAGPDAGAVQSIAITPSSATVALGANLTLSAEVRDGGGVLISGRRVTWSSENPTIADVSSSGVVTGHKLGTVMIAASSLGKDAFAIVTVNPTPVNSVRLSNANRTMRVGDVFQLSAEPLDAVGQVLAGRQITWATSAAEVATVTSEGLVTAVAQGGAIITATVEGRNASASITVSLVPVGSVDLQPGVSDVVVGQNTQLTAEVRDGSGGVLTGRIVTFTTDKALVATVSSSGLVTANSPGVAIITATSEGMNATATVNVSPRPVSAVIVSPGQVGLNVGQTAQLNIVITDGQGQPLTGRPVSFTSSNTQVVTVSTGGIVTGISPGAAVITATSEDKTGTADVTVSPEPVASVAVTPTPASIIVGHGIQLSATPKNAAGQPLTGRTISWRSGAPGLASVSSNGFVTGLAPGTAVIIATVDGIAGSGTITVRQAPVVLVSVTPSAATLNVGQTVSFTATTLDALGVVLTGRVVAWSSSDIAVATVAPNGDVTGIATGVATITATSEGQSGTASVTVGVVSTATVTVAPPSATVNIGQTVQLTATALDAAGNTLGGRAITWSSSADSIATVSSGGIVTGVAAGVATITATIEGKTASSTVTVTAPAPTPVASVNVSPSTVNLIVGGTQPVTATTLDAAGNTLTGRVVTWTTADPNVATVTSSGLITATGVGSTSVVATSEGQNGVVTVSVAAPSVASISISPSPATVNVAWIVQLTATPLDANGNPMTASISWSTSNPAVAVVSAGGVVTGVSSGSATITASSGSSSATTTVNVQLAPVSLVVVSPSNPTIDVGQIVQLTATLYDAQNNVLTGRTVTWSSADASKVSVNSNGLATGLKKGTTAVTASSEGRTGTADVRVR